jgi:hypothetical protein
MISDRTRGQCRATVVAGMVALGLALSGCSSDAGRPDASNGSTSPGRTTPTKVTSPATSDTASAGASSPLSSIVLRRSDVPAEYQSGSAATSNRTDPADDALHTCLGRPMTSGERTESLASASFGTEEVGVASTAARYSSQGVVDRDTELFTLPKAKECFGALLYRQFHGEVDVVSRTVEVRPGTNDGPANEAGMVSAEFVMRGNGGRRITSSFTMVLLTGPKLEAEVFFLGYSKQFDDALFTKLLFVLAARAAKG